MNILLSSYLMVSAMLLIALGVFGFKHQATSGMRAFSFLMLALTIHTLAYSLELLSPSLELMYFWVRVEYLGVAFYPFLILCFARDYTGEQRFANRYVVGLVFLISMITLFLVQTNPLHHFYYKTLNLQTNFGFATLRIEKAGWYNVQIVSLYFSMAYALIVLAIKMIKTRERARKRIIFVFVGISFPLLVSIIYLWGAGMAHIDLLPFSYLFLALFISYGLYYYDILTFYEVSHEVIFNAIDEAVVVVDGAGYILKMNGASEHLFERINPLRVGERINQHPILAEILELKKAKLLSLEEKHYQVRLIPIEKSRSVIIVFTDITEITQAKKQLETLANTDQLTSLYNRRYFKDCFNKLQEDGIVMMMDIDNFKNVNDQYGHLAGDVVLCELSKSLKEHFEDAIICRYGGEEFVVLIENEDMIKAKRRGEAFRHSFQRRQTKYPCTVTVGICPYQKESYNNTMHLVDKLLYQGKNTGRNCVVWD